MYLWKCIFGNESLEINLWEWRLLEMKIDFSFYDNSELQIFFQLFSSVMVELEACKKRRCSQKTSVSLQWSFTGKMNLEKPYGQL
jgi:hypothetical protein